MQPIVVALVIFFTPTSLPADISDLEDCSYYVRELTDEELLEYMKHYEYISIIDEIEKDAHLFDEILVENNSIVEVLLTPCDE